MTDDELRALAHRAVTQLDGEGVADADVGLALAHVQNLARNEKSLDQSGRE